MVIKKRNVEGNKLIGLSKFAQGLCFIKNTTTGQTKKLIVIKE